MEDPWDSIGIVKETDSSLYSQRNFEDNFSPDSFDFVPTSSSFEPLPDSSQYLANLEKRLLKLQKKSALNSTKEKQDFLDSLSGTREGHIDRLLQSSSENPYSCDEDFDEPIDTITGSLIKHIAPHLQAVTTGELVELLKADQLEINNTDNSPVTEDLSTSESNSQ